MRDFKPLKAAKRGRFFAGSGIVAGRKKTDDRGPKTGDREKIQS